MSGVKYVAGPSPLGDRLPRVINGVCEFMGKSWLNQEFCPYYIGLHLNPSGELRSKNFTGDLTAEWKQLQAAGVISIDETKVPPTKAARKKAEDEKSNAALAEKRKAEAKAEKEAQKPEAKVEEAKDEELQTLSSESSEESASEETEVKEKRGPGRPSAK